MNLRYFILNDRLYSLRNEWSELYQFCFQRARLASLLESVTKALNIVQLRPPQTDVTEID